MTVPPEQCSNVAKRFGISRAAPARSGAPSATPSLDQPHGDRGDEPGDDGELRLPTFVRFNDLVQAKIVGSWTQLARLQDEEGFPLGVLLGANTRAWKLDEVQAWLASRPTARKVPPAKRRGRPRKPAEAPAQQTG
jgi:predicted DNA-binding transcriptional regulator AlpA